MTQASSLAGRRTTGLWGLTYVAVVSALQVSAIALEIGPPLQPLLSIVFVLTCPGFLVLDLRRPNDAAAKVIIGIGASLAVNLTIVTVALVGNPGWVVPAIALVLAGIATLPRRQLRTVVTRVKALTAVVGNGLPRGPRALPAPAEDSPAAEPVAPEPSAAGVVAPDTEVLPEPTTSSEPAATTAELVTAPGTPPAESPASHRQKPLHINLASAPDLAVLPGVGAEIAARIVAHRTTNGAFSRLDDLLAVPGIGPARLSSIARGATIVFDTSQRDRPGTEE